MSPIHDSRLELRYPRLGFISAGYQTVSAKGKVHPTKSDSIVVHAARREILDPFAAMYGGTVAESPTSTEERERFFLVTEARELRVMLPGALDRCSSQYYEAWASSGLARRCDGVDVVLWRKPPEKDAVVGQLSDAIRPCICEEEGLDDKVACKPTVRLSVVPVDVAPDIPDMGVFVCRSTGYFTNSELKGDLELIRTMLGRLGAGVPLVLEVEQVRSARGLVPKFRLRLGVTPREAMAAIADADPRPMLAAPRPVDDEANAVGSFIDAPSEEVDVDGTAAENGSPNLPAAAVPDVVGEVVGLFGLRVEVFEGEPEPKNAPKATAAQWAGIGRVAARLGLDDEKIDAVYAARYGGDRRDATRKRAEDFDRWLRGIKATPTRSGGAE